MNAFRHAFALIFACTFCSGCLFAQNIADTTKKDTLVIVGVGDVMMGTIIPSRIYLGSAEKFATNTK